MNDRPPGCNQHRGVMLLAPRTQPTDLEAEVVVLHECECGARWWTVNGKMVEATAVSENPAQIERIASRAAFASYDGIAREYGNRRPESVEHHWAFMDNRTKDIWRNLIRFALSDAAKP